MASSKSLLETGLLECPMCTYTVLPADDYALRLHFEQVHTADSPFHIQDDPEPLPPSLRASPAPEQQVHDGNTGLAEGAGSSTVECPVSDCGEAITLIEYNDHLDLHAAATLSFDEKTGKYRSQILSTMASAAAANTAYPPSFLEENFDPDTGGSQKDGARKIKKKHRYEGERASLSRSIFGFNPFAKNNKIIKPPASSIRLGVS
jgi:hypothetical protein